MRPQAAACGAPTNSARVKTVPHAGRPSKKETRASGAGGLGGETPVPVDVGRAVGVGDRDLVADLQVVVVRVSGGDRGRADPEILQRTPVDAEIEDLLNGPRVDDDELTIRLIDLGLTKADAGGGVDFREGADLARQFGLKPPKPRVCESITRSPANDFFTWSSIDALIDAANTVNNATTATPIMRAAAAPLVRRGFRCAFSCAILPVTPRRRARGAPISRLTGPATAGPSTTNETIISSAPMPTRARPPLPLSQLR